MLTPMMEEEHRAAERAADEAMAELLAEELEAKTCASGAGLREERLERELN